MIDRAVAAVSKDDALYHVVARFRGNVVGSPPLMVVQESWSASNGSFHRQTFALRGGKRGKLLAFRDL